MNFERGERGRVKGERRNATRFFTLHLHPLPFTLFPIVFLVLAGCAVDDRRAGLPTGAQAAIDRLTEHYADGRFAEIYAEAADEWRAAATADESRATLASARERLGRVVSRATVRASVQENGAGALGGRTVSLNYNTKFERADAHEAITLVEREGRWRLARYTINSDALKP
jgi:hypothetical protein